MHFPFRNVYFFPNLLFIQHRTIDWEKKHSRPLLLTLMPSQVYHSFASKNHFTAFFGTVLTFFWSMILFTNAHALYFCYFSSTLSSWNVRNIDVFFCLLMAMRCYRRVVLFSIILNRSIFRVCNNNTNKKWNFSQMNEAGNRWNRVQIPFDVVCAHLK